MPRINVQEQLEAARKRIAARRQERRDRLLRRSARVTSWGTMDPFKRGAGTTPTPIKDPLVDSMIMSDVPIRAGLGVYPFPLIDEKTRASMKLGKGIPVGLDLSKMSNEAQLKFLQSQPKENVVRWINGQRAMRNQEVADFRERFQSRIRELQQLREQQGDAALRQIILLQEAIDKHGPIYDRLKDYKDLPPLTEEELYKHIQGGA